MVFSAKDLGIVAGIGIIIYMISKAGKDFFGALPALDEGLRGSISDISASLASTTQSISDITGTVAGLQTGVSSFIQEQQTNFDQFVEDSQTNVDQFVEDSQTNLGNIQTGIFDFFSNLFTPSTDIQTIPSQDETFVDSGQGGARSDRGGGFFSTPSESEIIISSLPISTSQQRPEIVSELPTQQEFASGGVGFIGGTIRENPVDTLSEVIDLFPQLTASQAADFLNEFSGISPTDALRIDPDVSNIVANIEGVNIQVPNISISDLDAAENRASCTTCELYGLNCDKCQIVGLNNA